MFSTADLEDRTSMLKLCGWPVGTTGTKTTSIHNYSVHVCM